MRATNAIQPRVATLRFLRRLAGQSVAPEVRYVYGGPARIGQKHRELGLGTRLVWRF